MGATAASGDLEGLLPGDVSPAGESRTRRESLSRWIKRTTGHHLDARSDKGFCEGLWDGVVLCRVLETLAPGVVNDALRADDPRLNRHDSPDKFLHKHNYEQFVAGAKRVGVKGGEMFSLQDLGGVTGSPGSVLRCLEAVRAAVGVDEISEDTDGKKTRAASTPETSQRFSARVFANETFAFETPPPTVYVPSVDFARLSLSSLERRGEDSETKKSRLGETRDENAAATRPEKTETRKQPTEVPRRNRRGPLRSGEETTDTTEISISSSFANESSSPAEEEVCSRRLPTTPPDTAGSAGSSFASPRSSSCSTVRRARSVSFGNPSNVSASDEPPSRRLVLAGGVSGGSSDHRMTLKTRNDATKQHAHRRALRHDSSLEVLSALQLESAESAARAERERRLAELERELFNARERLNEAFRREARATANAEDAERRAETASAEAERLRHDNEALRRKILTHETSATSDEMTDAANSNVTHETSRALAARLERVSRERDEAFCELETTRETLASAMRAAKKNDAESRRVAARLVVAETALRDVRDATVPSLRSTLESVRREAAFAYDAFAQKMAGDLATATSRLAAKSALYERVASENKKMHFAIQELKGSVRVFCRVRPFVPGMDTRDTLGDTKNETPAVVATTDMEGAYRQIVVTRRERRGDDARLLRRSFSFDRAFGPDASQAEVYAECGSLIRCVADGYNVCLLAYGQTGSGKTHTMSGPTNDFSNGFSFSDGDGDGDSEERALGVNYRALDDVFRTTRARDAVATHVVTVSVLEIYNEECRDLLAKSGGRKIDVSGFGAEPLNASGSNGSRTKTKTVAGADNVPDAVARVVRDADDVYAAMREGEANRSTGATAMNARSSRSHSVVIVRVEAVSRETNVKTRGALFLVDLAGSERVARSEASGDRLLEARHINKSLSALGDVVSALQHRASHVPYRNSKLTTLLRGALGPNGKALLFAHVSPCAASADESVSTLAFAERAAAVELGKARRFSVAEATKDTKANETSEREKAKAAREMAEMRLSVEAWEKRARDAETKLLKNTGRGVRQEKSGTSDKSASASRTDSAASSGRPTSKIPRLSVSQTRGGSNASMDFSRAASDASRFSFSEKSVSERSVFSENASYFDEAIPCDAFSSDRVSYDRDGETDEAELRRQAAAAAMSAAEATPPRPAARRFAAVTERGSIDTSADDDETVDPNAAQVFLATNERASPGIGPALSPLSALANASFADAGSPSPAAASAFDRAAVGCEENASPPYGQTVERNAAASKWRSAYDVVAAAHATESVRKKRSMYSRAAAAFGFAKKKPEARGRWQ
jgi:kinesin family protein C2/C3